MVISEKMDISEIRQKRYLKSIFKFQKKSIIFNFIFRLEYFNNKSNKNMSFENAIKNNNNNKVCFYFATRKAHHLEEFCPT